MKNTIAGSEVEFAPKVIETKAEHRAFLAEATRLAILRPNAGSDDARRLELIALLIDHYESKHVDRSQADPIEAIEFRMEQAGLSQRDLIPYIGSRSRVSEVLSRKRPLTLQMIRALHAGLGIPLESLIQEQAGVEVEVDWNRFPAKEMIKRGWIQKSNNELNAGVAEYITPYISGTGSERRGLFRGIDHVRSGRKMDEYALLAWSARVVHKAKEHPPKVRYRRGAVNGAFISKVSKLSSSDTGPLLAREFLRKHGISLVIEPHLSSTFLDGAAILTDPAHPIIGLTIRFDRLDNFWFTLAHELSHVALHSGGETRRFFDDLEVQDSDPRELEADKLAGESLIPDEVWKASPASRVHSVEAINHLATQLHIHPAIVAGRIRNASRTFRLFNNIIGRNQVRVLFSDVNWEL